MVARNRTHLHRTHVGPRRRQGGLAAVAGLSMIAGLSLGAAMPSGAATKPLASSLSPTALEAKAIADAEGSSWVHEVGHAAEKGHRYSADNDIGTFEGRQVIHADTVQAQVLQIGQEAYIKGNPDAIENFFELTKDDPQQLANTWISLVPSDGGEFSTVADAVTLKSDFDDVSLHGALTKGRPVTVEGARCIPIVGHATEKGVGTLTLTLYVSDTATPLPVELKARDKRGTSTTSWSRWGEPVSLTAPPYSVSYASLFG